MSELLTDKGEFVLDELEGLARTLTVDDDPKEVDLEGHARFEVVIEKFTDGRAYGIARTLRDRGFAGVLVATGDVRPDQVRELRGVGFDRFRLRAGSDLEVARRSLADPEARVSLKARAART